MRRQVANSEPARRASALILLMDSVARQVSMSEGQDIVVNNDGANQTPQMLREHFAPDAAAATYKEIVRFSHFKRTDQGKFFRSTLMYFDAKRKPECKWGAVSL